MILISGITSSIGIFLANLLLQKGYQVTGFARNLSKVTDVLNHPNLKLVKADLNDSVAMKDLAREASFIFHLAALSKPWGPYKEFYEINVKGTQSLLQAASHNLKRFIHVSTPSLYFDNKNQLNIQEDDPLPKKCVNYYAQTKLEAEKVVLNSGIPSIILRPRAVFGPYDTTLFPRLIKVCQNQGLPLFKNRSPIIDVTYVENVAHALWLAMIAPDNCLHKAYNITNQEPLSFIDLVDELLKKLSITIKTKHIPYPIAYTIAYLLELKSHLTKKEPLLTRYSVALMSFDQTLSAKKAQDELNYYPIITINEGIERYVRWLKNT